MGRRSSKYSPGYPVEATVSGISEIDYLKSGSVSPIVGSTWDVQGVSAANSSTAGIHPILIAGYHVTTGSLVSLPVTDIGLKTDTELEFHGGTLIANLRTFRHYSGTYDAALIDDNRRTEIVIASGTNLAGSITALQGTDPWTVAGTVTALPSGTQDIDIVAQSYKPLDVQLHSGTNLAGTLTARGEAVDLQQSTPADNYAFTNALETGAALSGFDGTDWDRLRTLDNAVGGTIATVGLLPSPLFGHDGSNWRNLHLDTSGNVITAATSTANVVIQTDNVNLMKTTNGTLTPITDEGNAFLEMDPLAGGTIQTPTGIQEVSLLGRYTTDTSGTLQAIRSDADGNLYVAGTITAIPSGTQDIDIVAQSNVPLINQLYAGTNQVGYVGITGGTISLTAGANQVVLRSGTNVIGSLYGTTSTINAVIQTDNASLMKTTGGTLTALQGTSPWVISGTVQTGAGTQDVDIVGQSQIPLISQLYAGTNQVGYVGITGGTISLTDRANQVVLRSGTNPIGSLYGTTSTINAIIQTDNANLMKSTNGTIATVSTISALTAGTVVTTPTGNIPLDRNEYIDRNVQTNVAAGATSYTINLYQGTNRALKEIYFYCGDAGVGAYFDTVLGTSTLGEIYYADTTFMTWDKTNWIASGTVTVSLNTGAVAASTVYTTLKYYHD